MVQHNSIDHTGITGVVSSYASNANSVASVAAGGAATTVSRGDHVHLGVRSISHTSNTFSGPVTLTASGSLGITSPSAGTLNFSAVDTTGAGSGDSDLAGKELDYVEITSDVTLTATSEGTAHTCITGSSVAYDGSTIIEITVEATEIATPADAAGRAVIVLLYEDSTLLGRLATYITPAAAAMRAPLKRSLRRTPTNASHSCVVKAYVTGGTGAFGAGAGGTGANLPAFIRITRVSS